MNTVDTNISQNVNNNSFKVSRVFGQCLFDMTSQDKKRHIAAITKRNETVSIKSTVPLFFFENINSDTIKTVWSDEVGAI